jgi:mono/diheme cytochrome c family protein
MSKKSPAKQPRGLRRALILLIIAAIWLLVLTAVSQPAPLAQAVPAPDATRGGRLYVSWDQVTNLSTQSIPQHPLWPAATPNQVPGAITWRCVNCHGWDYKGSDGKTLGAIFRTQGYPGLFNYTAAPIEEIVPALAGEINPDHDFSKYLTQRDLRDLAAFISSGLVLPNLIADPETFQVQGTVSVGEDTYNSFCRSCHGVEGERINFTTVQEPTYLGDIAWDNPWLIAHNIRYGHIASQVPAAARLGITFSQQLDIIAYTQTLPNAATISGPDYQNIDLSAQANTVKLAYGAVAIAVLIYASVGLTLWLNEKNLKQEELV